MLLIGGKELATSLRIVREAAGCKHHITSDADIDLTLCGAEDDAAHAPAALHKTHDWGGCAQLDVEIGGRSEQPSHQREAIAQLHPATVKREVEQMPAEAVRGGGKSAGRACDVHKRCRVWTSLDRHSHEGCF